MLLSWHEQCIMEASTWRSLLVGFIEELTVEPGIERHGGVCRLVGARAVSECSRDMQSIVRGRT